MLFVLGHRRRFRLTTITFALFLFTCSLSLGVDSASARRKRSRKAVIPYRSILLIEANTGRVLKAKNERLGTKPASIVKMMTALIAMEQIKRNIIHLDEIITVSRRASRIGGQQVYLAQGEKFALRDLMKSIIISSANDSSYAVAEHIAGDAEVFVEMMNQRAKELGMTNTHFVNVNGLPPGQKETDQPNERARRRHSRSRVDKISTHHEVERHQECSFPERELHSDQHEQSLGALSGYGWAQNRLSPKSGIQHRRHGQTQEFTTHRRRDGVESLQTPVQRGQTFARLGIHPIPLGQFG